VEAAELAASVGNVEAVGAFVMGVAAAAGLLDAKRMPAPLRIKTFIGKN